MRGSIPNLWPGKALCLLLPCGCGAESLGELPNLGPSRRGLMTGGVPVSKRVEGLLIRWPDNLFAWRARRAQAVGERVVVRAA